MSKPNDKLSEEEVIISKEKIKEFVTDRKKMLQLLKAAIPYVIIYFVLLAVINHYNITQDKVEALFAGFGLFLVPGFIIVQLLVSLTPLPDLPFIAPGVLFFKPWQVFILIWVGMWIGSIINFLIARKLGRQYIQRKYPQTAEWVDKFTGKYGFEIVVTGRAFTFVTFDLIAYAAGISNMTINSFGLATVFGLFPVALSATLVGLGFISGDLFLSILLFSASASVALIFGFTANRLRRKWETSQRDLHE